MANGFKFEDNSKKVMSLIDQIGEAGLEAAALLVEGQAKALAAVGNTGELRDKIDHRITTQGKNVVAQVGSPLDYAVYVEFGTGEFAENGAGRKGGWVYQDTSGEWFFTWGQDPQPYLRPAFRRNKKNIQEVIKQHYSAGF